MSDIKRREFLKKVGMGGAAMGAASFLPPFLKDGMGAVNDPSLIKILKSKPYEDMEVVETDLIIIGTGMGGMWSAVTAADEGVKRMAVVDKGSIGVSSGSGMILAGTMFWLDEDDLDACEEEYKEFNGGMVHTNMLRDMMQTGQRRWDKLKAWGVEYNPGRMAVDGNKHNKLATTPKYKNHTNGRAIMQCLVDRLDEKGVADYYSKTMITDLLTNNGKVVGAVGINRMNGKRVIFKAPAVILATGSCTFGPGFNVSAHQTGDGYAMAYRAGNRIQNIEFLNPDIVSRDYHIEGGHITAMLGARFINRDGEDFMWKYDKKNGSYSRFNTIAHAMADEWAMGKAPVYLDTTTILYKYFFPKFVEEISPETTWQGLNYKRLREINEPITDRPQLQSVMYYGLQGCIRTNDDLMSDEIEGLFVCSLSQSFDMSTLKGVSSARGMWSGERAGLMAPKYIKGVEQAAIDTYQLEEAIKRTMTHLERPGGQTYWELMHKFQNFMFKPEVALRKTDESQVRGYEKLMDFKRNELPSLYAKDAHDAIQAHELENMVQTAELYFRSSMVRKESRYSHRHLEYPSTDNSNWLKYINWKRDDQGKPKMSFEKVV